MKKKKKLAVVLNLEEGKQGKNEDEQIKKYKELKRRNKRKSIN